MMRAGILFLFLSALAIKATALNGIAPPVRQKINFDAQWKFFKGDANGAEKVNYPDKSWRILDLPHDWSIEGHYSADYGTDWQSGYLPAGIGWYRKSFSYSPAWNNKQVQIMFDGVYMNSQVWINGKSLGIRPNGCIGFVYDLTPYLKKGQNIIAVKVNNSKPQSARWYTGSGIYRQVWLCITNKINVVNGGTFITTPQVTHEQATVKTQTGVANQTPDAAMLDLETKIVDRNAKTVSVQHERKQVKANSTASFTALIKINRPNLWSPDAPYLYKVVSVVKKGGRVVDSYQTTFGVRKTEFSADSGFILNGNRLKIKGVCMHQDAGPVGVAVPADVLHRRLKLLKAMGCNAIRTSHNPFSPEFYDMCDSLGFMVLNEGMDGWDKPKARDDYGNYFTSWWKKDMTDFVLRDRNHPSVIMWSIGNEVGQSTKEKQQMLIDLFHQLDPTRPVTQGGQDPTRGMKGANVKTQLDVYGFNGDGEETNAYENFHAKYPGVPVIATEVPHTYQTRGVYRTDTHWRRRNFPAPWEIENGSAGTMKGVTGKVYPIPNLSEKEVFPEETEHDYYINGQTKPIANTQPWAPYLYYQSSYDNATVRSSGRRAWQRADSLAYVMGQFRWGSFDYLGESNGWPSRMANFGVLDICGFPKDEYYLYQSLWTSKPMVHLLPHWTHPGKEDIAIPVVAYTNCDAVELVLNGKSLGRKDYTGEQLVWQVPYQPGTIKAIAYQNGKPAATETCRTAREPAQLLVLTDKSIIKPAKNKVIHLEVTVADANGTQVPMANNNVTFKVSGPAKLIGVDNGDPLDLSDYKANQHRAFRGKCLAMIQGTGHAGLIKAVITCAGLKPAVINIVAEN